MGVAEEAVEWDDEAFQHALEQAAEGNIEARNVRLGREQLEQLLAAVPRHPDDPLRPQPKWVDFRGAVFTGNANFSGASFSGNANFSDARFRGNYATFSGAIFGGDAHFTEAIFNGNTNLYQATFGGLAVFQSVTFGKDVYCHETTFKDAIFEGANFEQARDFGPVRVSRQLALDGAKFERSVRIEVSASRVSLNRAVFRAGADLFVRWADVDLDDADFAEPSLVAGLPATLGADGKRSFLGWEELLANGGWEERDKPPTGFTPRVVSARRAKLARLTLSGVDLEPCQFAGAHGLDGLRLERAEFAQPPSRRRQRVRWTRRLTVAEEHYWRQKQSYSGWHEGDVAAPDWLAASEPLEADQIAGIYRDLRKGREDNKDTPGAGDFYYGEMEMRRQSAPFWEHSIIWLYWLVSGYGLRASRALACLLLTVIAGAVLLNRFGFVHGRNICHSILFSLESTISLLRAPDTTLTAGGEIVQIALRLLGPLFFGLALLALRGRVKR